MSNVFRDVAFQAARQRESEASRSFVVAIGIDRYRHWQPLSNAVSDARAAMTTFERLGFEPLVAPMFDEAATADAMRQLVADDLAKLDQDDNLVVFFAGHGHTVTRKFEDGDSVKTGYLIPADAELPGGSTTEWLRLDTWLSDIARLEVKHILVILDACHSGIALGSLVKWRGNERTSDSFERLRERRSRKVITSALDDQRALDSGPRPGHSLFTGCLLDGLDGDLARQGPLVTGSQLGLYVQNRVTSYPDSTQTPDFGAFEEDRRGELVFAIPTTAVEPAGEPSPAIGGGRRRRQLRAVLVLMMTLAIIAGVAWTSGRVQPAPPGRGGRSLARTIAAAVGQLRAERDRLDRELAAQLPPRPEPKPAAPEPVQVQVSGPKPRLEPTPRTLVCVVWSDDVRARPVLSQGKTCPRGCLAPGKASVRAPTIPGCTTVCVCER